MKGQKGLVSQLTSTVAALEKKLTRLLIQGCQRDCFLAPFLALVSKLSTGNIQSGLTSSYVSIVYLTCAVPACDC